MRNSYLSFTKRNLRNVSVRKPDFNRSNENGTDRRHPESLWKVFLLPNQRGMQCETEEVSRIVLPMDEQRTNRRGDLIIEVPSPFYK